jgi:hypothetical protein
MNKSLLAQIVPQSCVNDPFHCGWGDFNTLISNILNFMLTIVIPLAAVMIIYGGFVLLTSGGDAKKISQGRNIITAAVVGVVIVFGSLAIVNLIKSALGG